LSQLVHEHRQVGVRHRGGATLLGGGRSLSRCPFHRAGFSPLRLPRAFANRESARYVREGARRSRFSHTRSVQESS
jgi:hypothetical protein